MGRIHAVRVQSGSKEESRFINILESVGVKHDSVICKLGMIFDTPYDEYLISDGLYKLIHPQILTMGES